MNKKKYTFVDALVSPGGMIIGLLSGGVLLLANYIVPKDQGVDWVPIAVAVSYFVGGMFSYICTVNKRIKKGELKVEDLNK